MYYGMTSAKTALATKYGRVIKEDVISSTEEVGEADPWSGSWRINSDLPENKFGKGIKGRGHDTCIAKEVMQQGRLAGDENADIGGSSHHEDICVSH